MPAASAEIDSCVAEAADLQHPLRGIQGGEPGTLLQETGGTGLLDSQIFSGTDFLIPTLTFLHI